eukprot:3321523-Rhodomonas_salina.1
MIGCSDGHAASRSQYHAFEHHTLSQYRQSHTLVLPKASEQPLILGPRQRQAVRLGRAQAAASLRERAMALALATNLNPRQSESRGCLGRLGVLMHGVMRQVRGVRARGQGSA